MNPFTIKSLSLLFMITQNMSTWMLFKGTEVSEKHQNAVKNPESSLVLYGHSNKERASVCTRVGVHVDRGRHTANVSCP